MSHFPDRTAIQMARLTPGLLVVGGRFPSFLVSAEDATEIFNNSLYPLVGQARGPVSRKEPGIGANNTKNCLKGIGSHSLHVFSAGRCGERTISIRQQPSTGLSAALAC